jgi:glycosyltransferase involved in cell wall biosynthesis
MEKVKLKIFTRYAYEGPSSRMRFFQFAPELEEMNYAVQFYPLMPDGYVRALYQKRYFSKFKVLLSFIRRVLQLITIKKSDLIWIEKELFPYLPPIFEVYLKLRGINYIVDYDDAVFHQYDLHSNPLIRTFLSKKIDLVMKNSALVTAGNNYLASRAKEAGAQQVEILPTVVSEKLYIPKESQNAVPVIGWIGTPVTQKFLIPLLPIFEKLSYELDFKVRFIGASEDLWNSPQVDYPKWSEEKEIELIQSIDIGIMPLTDSPFERGKCGFKLIQYMACGKAVLASPVGVNCEIVKNHINGKLVASLEDWEREMRHLLTHRELISQYGGKGHEIFLSDYSKSQVVKRLRELFLNHLIRIH